MISHLGFVSFNSC